ncbi:MAG: diversity-generating retroelement protein Avd [Pseudomonadales bacterium]|nr:diversity-generating retroelement protein Avd [Pseudomonadales bacterium]
MTEDLRIQTKLYQLMHWLLPKAERFPRLYRTTVTQRVMDAVLDLQENITAAVVHSGSVRQKHLKQADVALNIIRTYLRLITDWQWLSLSQYEHVSLMVVEIGRMVGAWLKRR